MSKTKAAAVLLFSSVIIWGQSQYRICPNTSTPLSLDAFANDLASNGPCSSGFLGDGPVFDFYKISGWKGGFSAPLGTSKLSMADVQVQIGSTPSSVYLSLTTARFAQIPTQLLYSFRFSIQAEGTYINQQVQGIGMSTCPLGLLSAAAVFGTGAGIPASVMVLDGDLFQYAGDRATVSYNADTLVSIHVNTENYPGCTATTGTYRVILAQ